MIRIIFAASDIGRVLKMRGDPAGLRLGVLMVARAGVRVLAAAAD